MSHLESACEGVIADLTALYEPLWEAPINTQLLKDHYLPGKTSSVGILFIPSHIQCLVFCRFTGLEGSSVRTVLGC